MSDRSKTANRTCEQCGGAMPHRTSRQRNDKGQLVCDSCKNNPAPAWNTTHSALSVVDQQEMRRREAEAISSIVRVRKAKHAGILVVAHDSGDNAIINHCPFCGSGAVVGGSNGTVTCDFCHTPFTVQVQPAHPFMPQTIDGAPTPPAGMPGDAPTEMSAPVDPTVNEQGEDVAADPLGDADPAVPSNGPVRPGQPPHKQPPANQQPSPNRDKDKKPGGGNKPPWLKNKSSKTAADGWKRGDRVSTSYSGTGTRERLDGTIVRSSGNSLTIELDSGGVVNMVHGSDAWKDLAPASEPKQAFRTAEGHTLDADAYMARLALSHADDRESVLDAVRVAHLQREAADSQIEGSVNCPKCKGEGDIENGIRCDRCNGSGAVMTKFPWSSPNRTAGLTHQASHYYPLDLVELQPGAWYYTAGHDSYLPEGSEDEEWDTEWGAPQYLVGPFSSEDAAFAAVSRWGGNPGSYNTFRYPSGEQFASLPIQRQGSRTAAMKPCPTCKGIGEVDTGRTEPDTGAPITADCPRCHGLGELDDQDPENFDLREPPKEAKVAAGTKKVRGSALAVGMSIGGHKIIRRESQNYYGAPGSNPWTQITVYFEPSDDPNAPIMGTYGSSEWVEIDR